MTIKNQNSPFILHPWCFYFFRQHLVYFPRFQEELWLSIEILISDGFFPELCISSNCTPNTPFSCITFYIYVSGTVGKIAILFELEITPNMLVLSTSTALVKVKRNKKQQNGFYSFIAFSLCKSMAKPATALLQINFATNK